MRFILSAVCFCLTLCGFTQIRAQDQLTTSASPAANSAASKPTTSQPQPGLSGVKILLPGETAAMPTTVTVSSPEPSLYLKGLTFLDTGQNAEAVEALRQAVEHDPNDAAAYGKLGVAYAALGQYKEAVVALKMAIRVKPEIVDAEDYYHLSRAYTALEKFPLALEAIKLALYIKRADQVNHESGNTSRGPATADLHYSAGLAFYNLKRFREANEELKQVIALNPKHAPGQFGLALTYLATGDRKAAEKQQEVLETLDPVYAAKLAKLLAIKSDNPQGLVFVFKSSP
ncbi:MAG TPA: tetratricopeptide repeat protein [Pyrinomonadaceae bacterium]